MRKPRGILVHTTVDGFFNYHIQDYVIEADDPTVQDAFWIGVTQTHFNVSYTNAAGVTMFQMERNTTQEDPLIDNGDGTWTYRYTVNGQPLRLKSRERDGTRRCWPHLHRSSSTLVTSRPRPTDFFVSEKITRVIGPHPVAESDFAPPQPLRGRHRHHGLTRLPDESARPRASCRLPIDVPPMP